MDAAHAHHTNPSSLPDRAVNAGKANPGDAETWCTSRANKDDDKLPGSDADASKNPKTDRTAVHGAGETSSTSRPYFK